MHLMHGLVLTQRLISCGDCEPLWTLEKGSVGNSWKCSSLFSLGWNTEHPLNESELPIKTLIKLWKMVHIFQFDLPSQNDAFQSFLAGLPDSTVTHFLAQEITPKLSRPWDSPYVGWRSRWCACPQTTSSNRRSWRTWSKLPCDCLGWE